jgi:hypothetical protein
MTAFHKYRCLFCIGWVALLPIWSVQAHIPFNTDKCQKADRQANIDPDYSGTVIPPNIAPLNFVVKEPGTRYCVEISSSEGKKIEISSKQSSIVIPMKSWKKLLRANPGEKIRFDIYVKDNQSHWIQFDPIINRIAKEEIDPYVVYRLLQPMYYYFSKMGLYQRNLENYQEKPLFLNRVSPKSCMNCHVFCNNDPGKMMFHVRGADAGMMLMNSGQILKINTQTEFNPSAAVYPAWHPSGKLLAFSINKLRQFFHAVGNSYEVVDYTSDLILYLIDSNTVTTCPAISSPDRLETFPSWSPDGAFLYFSSAPTFESYTDYKKIRYDLMRIGYDQKTGAWGKPEILLPSSKTGLSMSFARVSPDGRYLLFCGADHGNFPTYLESSDLYLMDLKTKQVHPLKNVNSDRCDSYHSWSSESRWFTFSSKRQDHLCALLYFSYVDEKGNAYKPFLLPQKDPNYYTTFLRTYNLPELIKAPVPIRPQKMTRAVLNKRDVLNANLDPRVIIPDRSGEETTPGQSVPQ